jgi:hypothetical protein
MAERRCDHGFLLSVVPCPMGCARLPGGGGIERGSRAVAVEGEGKPGHPKAGTLDRRAVLDAIRRHETVSAAAAELAVSRTALRRYIDQYADDALVRSYEALVAKGKSRRTQWLRSVIHG